MVPNSDNKQNVVVLYLEQNTSIIQITFDAQHVRAEIKAITSRRFLKKVKKINYELLHT